MIAYNRSLLIMEAFDLKPYQVAWSPGTDSQKDVYYDIVAKADGDATPSKSEFRRMLQTLLADRFHLKIQAEPRTIAVYALTVGRNGPKFRKSAPDSPATGVSGVHGRNQTITMPRESMEALADAIPNIFMVNRPVVDRTGLAGTYDIELEATPEFRIERDPKPEDSSVFTAIQEQLGLKLEPVKATVQVWVAGSIDQPSEN